MSETSPTPEHQLTEAQETALKQICERYEVEYSSDHYRVNPPDAVSMPGWGEGWVGGPHHANPKYGKPAEPAGKPTIYIACSPEGLICS